ncbi:MAG: cell division protein ZipA C-terminal FtsZ-binding domain-containing protein [Pseudomonadota bacterium]
MPELQWVLIGLGLLFLVGLAVWEWRKSRRQHFSHTLVESSGAVETPDRTRRVEPSFDGMAGVAAEPDMVFDVPTIHPVEPMRVALSAGSAVDIPSAARFEFSKPPMAAPPIQWPPADAGRVLSLRVVGSRGEPLSGHALRNALEAAGLRHGPQKIFHLTTPEGAVLVSVANLMQPGSLDPAAMDTQQLKGLNVFSVLSGTLPPAEMLEKLVGLARALAQRLGAVVQDADGHNLDGVRLTQLQQSLDGP